MTARGGEAQRLVRETMAAAGGYWRPLAAVARLLEELGELSEQLEGADGELAGELADLWIITTALADQFLAAVREPGEGADGPGSPAALLLAAGQIARVVNHYDGPKLPRAGRSMPSLRETVERFHGALASLAEAQGVELAGAVRAKIEQIHRRGDIERFARDGFDPSTAAVIERAAGGLAELLPERLWGAPDHRDGSSPAASAAAIAPSLVIFAKAARAERLEGFVIEGPRSPSAAGRAAWLGALIAELDPTGGVERFELAGATLSAALAARGDGRAVALVTPR